MYVTSINGVLGIESIVYPNQIFAIIERVGCWNVMLLPIGLFVKAVANPIAVR